jgi:polysaccharide export outer membrane protein
MPASGFGAEDPQSPAAPQAQHPPNRQDATPDASAGARTAAPPAIPAADATDPAKLAEPKAAPDAKVPGAVPIDASSYIIGPLDVLAISVWEQPQLNCSCTVRSDGMITVPLINEIKASGLTPLELGHVIADALSAKALVDPQVTVNLMAPHSRKYILYGQVRAPGERDLIVPTTVMQAIMSAGGFVDWANQKDITIVRGDKRLKFNFKEVIKGKDTKQNILLEPGDIIYVK